MTAALRWLPNLLTVLRLLAGMAFPFVPREWWLPLVLFGGLSDLVDGWISRMTRGTTTFGQLLDPIADKTFVLAVAATMLANGLIGWLGLLWLATRDLVVLALSLTAAVMVTVRPSDLRPRWSGKCATAAQFLALSGLVVLQQPLRLIVLAAGLMSAIAAMDYTLTACRNWRGRSVPEPCTK